MPGLRGRPRDNALDTAITDATKAVLLSDGYAAVNIDRVAKLAGTTRAAIYRRAKTRGELVVGLLVANSDQILPRTVGSCAGISCYCSSCSANSSPTR